MRAQLEAYRRLAFPEPAQAIVASRDHKWYRLRIDDAERACPRAGLARGASHHVALEHVRLLELERFPRAGRDARRVLASPADEREVREFEQAYHAVIPRVLDVAAYSAAVTAIETRV